MQDDLVQLHQNRLKQTSNKKVRPCGFQETFCLKRHCLSNQTLGTYGCLNYEGACAMTLVTTNVDKPSCRCSQEILCQNIQKSIKSKKSKIKKARWVANLKRRLRQKWASRWTENPKGRSRQKLETWAKISIMIDWKPTRAIYAKVKDHVKVTASGQAQSTWGIQSLKDLRFEASVNQKPGTGAIQSC